MPNTVNSQIVYGILPSTYSDNFTIDPNTGVLTESGDLDRESLDSKLQGRVELKVTATDKGTPPLSSNVTVIVNIEVSLLQLITVCNDCASCRSFLKCFFFYAFQDINDNIPQFDQVSYTFSVKEGQKGI